MHFFYQLIPYGFASGIVRFKKFVYCLVTFLQPKNWAISLSLIKLCEKDLLSSAAVVDSITICRHCLPPVPQNFRGRGFPNH